MNKEENLPKGWNIFILDEVLESLENGNRPKGGIKDIKEGVPSLGGEHLNGLGGFKFDNRRLVTKEYYDNLKRGKIQRYDILVVKDGATTGKTSFVDDNFPYEEAAVNEHVFILRGQGKIIDQKFLFYHLFSPIGQLQIAANFRGAAIGGINSKFVDKYKIVVPPPATQQKIVTILDRIEQLKKMRVEANSLTDEYLKSVFLKMFGDPINNPNKFKEGKIKDLVLKTQYGTSKKASEDNEGIPILRMNNITYKGCWDLSELKFIKFDEEEKQKYLVYKGELLFNRTNSKELVGKSAVYKGDIPMAFAGYLVKLITESPSTSEFIAGHLNSPYGKAALFNMAKNIVGMANINAKEVQKIQILIPPIEIREQYAKIVNTLESIKTYQNQSKNEIENLFNLTLQKAFKGELVC